VVASVLGMFAAIPYLAGEAVWDDHTLIVDRLAQLDVNGIAALWTHPVGGGEAGGAYYRPVSVTLLALLGRHGMGAIHLFTALLHAVSAALVCVLAGRSRLALVGAGLFALHPICAEVLGWASALPDALAVCLGLAGLWLAGTRDRPLAAIVLFTLAVASKEVAVVWPLVGLVAFRVPRRTAGWSVLAVLCVLALRPVLGVHSVRPMDPTLTEAVAGPLSQLGALLWPLPLTAVRDTHHLSMLQLALGAGLLALLAVGVWAGRRAALGPALGVVAAPMLAIPTLLSSHLAADRYVYLSLACLGLVVGALPRVLKVEQLLSRRVVVWGAGGLALVLASVHVQAAEMWRTDVALFETAVKVTPRSSYAHYFAGHARAQAGTWPLAAQHFEAAARLTHPHPLSRRLAVEAWVRGGEPHRGVALARAAPKDGVTADWIAWWARAELDAGNADQSLSLVVKLRRSDGSWDGPHFVADLADRARQAVSATPRSDD